MTPEEKAGIYAGLNGILASIRQIEMKLDAAEQTLESVHPRFHQEYQKALASMRTNVVNDISTIGEYLRETLSPNTPSQKLK